MQGVVVIETVIDEAGAVKEAWVLKSVPLLDEAALEAVRQWRYAADADERRTAAGADDRHRQLHARALAAPRASPAAKARLATGTAYDAGRRSSCRQPDSSPASPLRLPA